MPEPTGRSLENFVKAVYVLQQESDRVSTNALADALNIQPPSVTDMARRLELAGLLDYQKYRGVMLTEKGMNVALKVLRRHRLIELYLQEELGYALREVHQEAEELEHHVSDRFIDAISEKLGHPNLDPHGDPIPNADGEIVQRNLQPLSQLPLHQEAIVARLRTEQPDMLQHILDRGFNLDTSVQVVDRDPFEGPLTIQLGEDRRVIGHNVASCIWVQT
jgi:DtxR family Mn-dependent transcriptional regulator